MRSKKSGRRLPYLIAMRSRKASQEVVKVSGDEFGEFPDTPEGKKELRDKAIAEYSKLIGVESVMCPALGSMVDFRATGRKEVKHWGADSRKMKLLPRIKEIIANGELRSSSPPDNPEQDKSAIAYHYLRTPVEIAGELLAARVVIKEDNNGVFHYDLMVRPSDAIFDSAKASGPAIADPFTTTNSKGGGTYPSRIASGQPVSSLLDDVSGVNMVGVDEVLNLFIEGEVESEVPDEVIAPESPVTAADLGHAS